MKLKSIVEDDKSFWNVKYPLINGLRKLKVFIIIVFLYHSFGVVLRSLLTVSKTMRPIYSNFLFHQTIMCTIKVLLYLLRYIFQSLMEEPDNTFQIPFCDTYDTSTFLCSSCNWMQLILVFQ